MGLRQFVCVFLALWLAACAGSNGPVVSTGDRYQTGRDLLEAYVLGPGDKVRITVFNEPNLSGEYSVGSDGVLSLPLIGEVSVSDRTTKAVSDEVANKLAGSYLRDPKVSAEVTSYRPFFILGEVTEPGQYPYVAGMTVLNAIATAKGFTPRAHRDVVLIRGRGEGTEMAYRLSPELRVLPGDTIRLSERYF